MEGSTFNRGAPPERTCGACGLSAHTWSETCDACGANYFAESPRFSRKLKFAAAATVAALLIIALAIAVPALQSSADKRAARDARARAATVVAERARLTRVQQPHRGEARSLLPAAGASDAAKLSARAALVERVRQSVLVDARARVVTGELEGPVRKVLCAPLQRTSVGSTDVSVGDERDLTKHYGRYDCVAAKRDVVQTGKVVGTFGYPFIAAVDFRKFTYVWCRDGAKAPGERGQALAVVRIARACLAAHGRPFGNGYMRSPLDR